MRVLELKVLPVPLAVFTALLMWGISEVLPDADFYLPFSYFVSSFIAAIGGIIALLGLIAFRKADTTVDPRVPHQTTTLVISGIYRLTRNPMYLGLLITLIGWCFFLSNYLSVALVPVFFIYVTHLQIKPEEKHLTEKFGDEYRSYMKQVNRWI